MIAFRGAMRAMPSAPRIGSSTASGRLTSIGESELKYLPKIWRAQSRMRTNVLCCSRGEWDSSEIQNTQGLESKKCVCLLV